MTLSSAASANEEEKVIARIQAGAVDEYRELIGRHDAKIYRLLVKAVGDRDIAKDLTHEVSLRAYRALQEFPKGSDFSTWLTRIALKVANSYFFSRKYRERKRERSLEADDTGGVRRRETLPNANTDVKPHLELYQGALGELRPIYRDALILCALEGKTYEEASEVAGVPVGAVRSRLDRARTQIQDILAGKD